MMTAAPKKRPPQPIRAYGDRMGDGALQMAFTLPVPPSARAKEAARQYAESHGLRHVLVTTMEKAGESFSFFVVYGRSDHTLDFSEIEVPEVAAPEWTKKQVSELIQRKLGRPVVIVGACTGSDAHTVGIDAIINIKGYAGDKGLESYAWIEAHNLGAQVDNAQLLARCKELSADAVLVSQVVTQRDVHKENARDLIDLARKRGMRELIFVLGGPRIDNKLARELGFDAGFGSGTRPREVASYVVDQLIKRKEG